MGDTVISDEQLKAKILAGAVEGLGSTKNQSRDIPTEIISLPSQGLFYPENHPLRKGTIEMRYMTAKEEDILATTSFIKHGVVLDKLLQALIVTEVDYNSILVVDKNAIFIAARILAYGNDYQVEMTCPSTECGAKSRINIDLSTFEDRPMDWDMIKESIKPGGTFEYKLPISKRVLELKLLTHGDEMWIDEKLKKHKDLSKKAKTERADPELTTRLMAMIVGVDGSHDRLLVEDFVSSMLSRDSVELRKFVKTMTPEISTTFTFECTHCGYIQEGVPVPINVNFFWPGLE